MLLIYCCINLIVVSAHKIKVEKLVQIIISGGEEITIRKF